jgi:hypothetical protein
MPDFKIIEEGGEDNPRPPSSRTKATRWAQKKPGSRTWGETVEEFPVPYGYYSVRQFAERHDVSINIVRAWTHRPYLPLPSWRDPDEDERHIFIPRKEGDRWMLTDRVLDPMDKPAYERAIREKMNVSFKAIDTLVTRARKAGWTRFADALDEASRIGRAEVEEEIANAPEYIPRPAMVDDANNPQANE